MHVKPDQIFRPIRVLNSCVFTVLRHSNAKYNCVFTRHSAVAVVITKTPSMIILGSGEQALIQRTHLERIRGPKITFKTYFRRDVYLHNLLSSRGSDYSKVVLLSQQLDMLYLFETFQVQSH